MKEFNTFFVVLDDQTVKFFKSMPTLDHIPGSRRILDQDGNGPFDELGVPSSKLAQAFVEAFNLEDGDFMEAGNVDDFKDNIEVDTPPEE